MFTIAGEVVLQIKNLKPGNEITQTMPSGVLVIGETEVPFVLQRKVRGNINGWVTDRPGKFSLSCFEQRATAFTKQGYVSLLLSIPQGMFYIYIKREYLKDFYAAVCMALTPAFIN